MENKEQPKITKAPFGDVWRIEFENKTIIKNQKGVEQWLTQYNKTNER